MATQAGMKTGTLSMADLLANRFVSAYDFGLNTIQEVLSNDLAVHNRIITDMMGELADVTTDKQRIQGTSVTGRMVKADELTRAPTQRELPGQTVGFPLEKFQTAIGWTSDFMKEKTPADLAAAQNQAEKGHLFQLRAGLQYAIYNPTNYSFTDQWGKNIALNVKSFYNADSSKIPDGPNGEIFDGTTHTHYTAASSLAASDILALVRNVLEHGFGGQIRIIINQADETAFRALSGFTPYLDPRISLNANANQSIQRLDLTRLDNRAIGIFGAAEVWVKPWALANYAFAYDTAAAAKPLAMRQKDSASFQGLRLAGTLDTFPLYAEYMEAYFGFGVWSRGNGAVHYFAGSSYAAPTFSLLS